VKNRGLKYKRVLLKISGEAIGGKNGAFDLDAVRRICGEIGTLHGLGCEIGIVIGGGNIIRGTESSEDGLDRTRSDYMGMLATIINGILFDTILQNLNVPAVVQSALRVETLTEDIVLRHTSNYLAEGRVILFTGGTGSPYFTTDTAAALRACEIGADALLKATKVDGVYDRDPVKFEDATFFPTLSYQELLYKNLKVIDMAAVAMCRDQRIPIIIFNLLQDGNIERIVRGYDVGTIVKE
jgi:uridylate kinase